MQTKEKKNAAQAQTQEQESTSSQEKGSKNEKKGGKKKALAVREAKIGRTVFHPWRKQQPFDAQKFLR